MQVLPDHELHDVPWFEPYSYFEPADLDSDYMEQEAAKGKGAFIQALWTQYAIPKLYVLVYKAWRQYGAQNLTTCTQLAQAVLDECFGQKWLDSVFQVQDSCSICLSTMHWPEKTHFGDAFHLRCLLRHPDSWLKRTQPHSILYTAPLVKVDQNLVQSPVSRIDQSEATSVFSLLQKQGSGVCRIIYLMRHGGR
ncbi:hypothetical protein TNCV_768621 [Trichonephila clavipes]|nr:hypothetical protein TNCV_768621 [Trichonephila clavipes]